MAIPLAQNRLRGNAAGSYFYGKQSEEFGFYLSPQIFLARQRPICDCGRITGTREIMSSRPPNSSENAGDKIGVLSLTADSEGNTHIHEG
jgi:hypothetical protein